jgi:hypothetical protein
MKRQSTACLTILLCAAGLIGNALGAGAQARSSSLINGSFTSIIQLLNERQYPDGGGSFSQGWSNVANLRYKVTANDSLSFSISANLSAVSGFSAQEVGRSIDVELERLYFKAGNDWLDFEAGLIRIARGYGYVFSPMDVFGVRDATNSLDPQARPAGKWGLHATFFPGELWKIELFGLASDDPFEEHIWGSKLGAATTFSLGKVNVDFLSALYLPEIEYESDPSDRSLPPYTNNDFTGLAGFAVKADVEIGVYVEAVYRLERRALREGSWYGKDLKGYEGLEAVLGADYTIPGLDLYLLAEYLFYGPGHVDWGRSLDTLYTSAGWENEPPADRLALLDLTKKPLPYARHDYLFLLARYSPRQDQSVGVSCLAGLDDLSALMSLFGEYEVVQGLTLQASLLVPVDRRLFDPSARPGEWGSTSLGFHQMLGLGAKVRF